MRKLLQGAAALILLATFSTQPSTALAQGTAFTYQGRLDNGTNPATGIYDLRFTIYDLDAGGNQVGPTLTNAATAISNGLFTVTLDFGNQFPGAARWLEIGVRTNGAADFTTLMPLQQLTPVPSAIFSSSASNLLGSLPASQLNGPVTSANLPAGPTISGTVTADGFSGDGSGLSNINAYSLTGLTADNLWKVGGNAGANPTNGAFLGTADNLPLEFWVNTNRALRLEYAFDNGFFSAAPNVIGGCANNVVNSGAVGAFIGGGGNNSFNVLYTYRNRVSGDYGSVVGGLANVASGFASTAMGYLSTASGYDSTAMGASRAIGSYSTAMGNLSIASGSYSMAAGNLGYAAGDGSFAWNSFSALNLPENANQFGIYGAHGLNVDYYTQRADGGGSRWFYVGDNIAGDTIHCWNGAHLTDGGVWANASDKNRKTDFSDANPQTVLARLATLPVRYWRYTNEVTPVQHLGPTAQDFMAAFALGTDDKSIGTVDEGGVAFAAIQGLNQKVEEQNSELKAREADIRQLKQDIAELKQLISQITQTRSKP